TKTETQNQYRVGVFVLAALAGVGLMIFQFGELESLWQERYVLAIHFEDAPGVFPSTPVRRSGVAIGEVRAVRFDDRRGGVLVLVEIGEEFRLREDARPKLTRSLLGDSSIDFVPGRSNRFLKPGAELAGEPPVDPLAVVARMEDRVAVSLETFNSTAREWERVGQNLNGLMETNRGNVDLVIERAAESLHEFSVTMRNFNKTLESANQIVADPRNQENLRRTLAALPAMIYETRETIAAVRLAVAKADQNLANLAEVTGPLADRSTSIVTRLDMTLANLQSVSDELNTFVHLVVHEEGTAHKLATDPALYDNLNRSAEAMTLLLQNLEPVLRDVRIFSDKIARHPELM
ncbi:MAG: MlaD family protein, partial [Planctomycetaceae bacterium]